MWASHDVRLHRTGTKLFFHPVVGRLELDYEALMLPADTGLQMNVYTAVPNSPSADGLALLASWAATTLTRVGAEPRHERGRPMRKLPKPPTTKNPPSCSPGTSGSTRSPRRRTTTSG